MITFVTLNQVATSPQNWVSYTQQIDTFDWNGAKFLANKMKKQLGEKERVTLALDGEQVIGVGALVDKDIVEIPETPYFSTLYVLPAYRNYHFAHKIVEKTVSEAKNLNYKQIYVVTQLENFYEKLGFTYKKQVIDFMGREMKLYRQELLL